MLLVHGESQIEILKSKLNWPKNKLHLIESFRFRLKDNGSLSKKIFIPLAIHNHGIFKSEFKRLLINSSSNSFPRFDVKNPTSPLNKSNHKTKKVDNYIAYCKAVYDVRKDTNFLNDLDIKLGKIKKFKPIRKIENALFIIGGKK